MALVFCIHLALRPINQIAKSRDISHRLNKMIEPLDRYVVGNLKYFTVARDRGGTAKPD